MTQVLSKRTVAASTAYPPRILQFGTGNFLRAFIGPMVQALQAQTDFAGSLVMVKATNSPSRSYETLTAQDGYYHLWTRGVYEGQELDELQLITCASHCVHPYAAFEQFLALASVPELEFVVSNTTEAGIQFEPEDWPAGAPAHHFPGKLTQLLYARFQYFQGDPARGWVMLPCELIEANGQALRECVLQYATHWQLGKAFQEWINSANIFCDTLVDRIVPGFPQEEAAEAYERLGFVDQQLVVAEPYLLWAIEAPMEVRQRLPLDQIGMNVQFTERLAEYRTLKVRLLNGAHTAMVPVGLRTGFVAVGEFAEAATGRRFLEELLLGEIQPSLPHKQKEVQAYVASVLDRFHNPFIQHRLADIALNSIAKFRTRLWPSLRYHLERDGQAPPRLLQAFVALLLLYRGDVIALRDEAAHLEYFASVWTTFAGQERVDQLLGYTDGWGVNLRQYQRFCEQVGRALERIQ
ncbi:MAG: tagaturonate reductase [Bacteroidota bacterium]